MKASHPAFTLAELLVALAILGIIAAFTIPKVFTSSGNKETKAKLASTVAALELSYQKLLIPKNTIDPTKDLYGNIINNLNVIASGSGAPDAAGAPYSAAPNTDCANVTTLNGTANGWVQFANGVVVTGLASGVNLRRNPPNNGAQFNTIICIDMDAKVAGGSYIGTFSQWGDFDLAGGTNKPAHGQKSFDWGNSNPQIQSYDGSFILTQGSPEFLVGYQLMKN